jgi:hypothetical protein
MNPEQHILLVLRTRWMDSSVWLVDIIDDNHNTCYIIAENLINIIFSPVYQTLKDFGPRKNTKEIKATVKG